MCGGGPPDDAGTDRRRCFDTTHLVIAPTQPLRSHHDPQNQLLMCSADASLPLDMVGSVVPEAPREVREQYSLSGMSGVSCHGRQEARSLLEVALIIFFPHHLTRRP